MDFLLRDILLHLIMIIVKVMKNSLLRNATSITCGCNWYIRFRDINSSNTKVSTPVIITYVCGVHSNMYNLSYVNQFFLVRTRYDDYNNCADQCLILTLL